MGDGGGAVPAHEAVQGAGGRIRGQAAQGGHEETGAPSELQLEKGGFF